MVLHLIEFKHEMCTKKKNIKIDIEVKISSKQEENLSLIHFQNFEVIPVIYVYLLCISYII